MFFSSADRVLSLLTPTDSGGSALLPRLNDPSLLDLDGPDTYRTQLADFFAANAEEAENVFFDLYSGPSISAELLSPNGRGCISGDLTSPSCDSERARFCASSNWRETYRQYYSELGSQARCGAEPCANAQESCDGIPISGIRGALALACVPQTCQMDGVVDARGNLVMAPCFVGDDPDELRSAFESLFESVSSCTIGVETSAAAIESGTVFLDDDPLDASLWTVLDGNRVQLLAEACTTLRDGEPHRVSVEIDTCE